MDIGVAYYPEHVDEGQRKVDMDRIADIGFKSVRVGDFAWSRMEQSSGSFTWDWLDQTFELAAERGITILLCTPTAAPPAWLVQEDPGILPKDRNGRTLRFGARQHRCYNNSTYREHSRVIASALSERYGRHEALLGWQIDNEMGGEVKRCYCETCRLQFIDSLKEQYHTIGELNHRWGTVFWSQVYPDWDAVHLPLSHAGDLLMKHHPSLELAFRRFCSDSIVAFARMQTEILKKASGPGAIVTTNADPFVWGDNVDLSEMFQDLDIGAIDLYSQDPAEIAFYADFFRSLKGERFWMNEYPPRSPAFSHELPILAERGCERLFFFKYRPFPWGQEQGGRSVLTMTNQPGPQYSVISDWASHPRKTTSPKPEVGILYSFESSWSYDLESWSFDDWEVKSIYPKRMIHELSAALYADDVPIRFLFKDLSFEGLHILFAPWLIIHDESVAVSILSWIRDGGHFISTTDLFRKNSDNVFLQEVPGFYRRVFGNDCVDFFYSEDNEGVLTVAQGVYGSGTVTITNEKVDGPGWHEVIERHMS